VSYAWPEDRLIELTLAQAAVFGRLVAFAGDMILGHEMHLETMLGVMAREGLALVYFAESRHQKGDWFVAKRRAPHVVLAHRFTPQDMIPLDLHAAAQRHRAARAAPLRRAHQGGARAGWVRDLARRLPCGAGARA
jgi:hypothetical protein